VPSGPAADGDRNVVLIGHGALARYVIECVGDEPGIRVSAVIVRAARVGEAQKLLPATIRAVACFEAIEHHVDLVVELAGHSAVALLVPEILERGIDVAIASTGALADDQLQSRLLNSAERGHSQLHILSGAVGAIDALAAHREGDLHSVLYTGTKPPAAWKDTPAARDFALDQLTSAVTIYEGSAREAARSYPRNANVAATVALAGVGFDRTRVRLVAAPGTSENAHRIEASSSAGTFVIELVGKPIVGNPRTSLLTALSAVRTARNRARRLVV
jgi:aspartate dehydrogenase